MKSTKSTKFTFSVTSLITISIYIIAFYSTFRNTTIYIFGEQQFIRHFLDIVFLGLLILTFFLILLVKSRKNKVNPNIKYIIPLLLWVLLQSIATSIGVRQNLIPRVLITGLLAALTVTLGINSEAQLKKTVWASALGLATTAIIPLTFYPELIGTRISVYNGVDYSGSFWNYSLISFVSIAWILLGLVNKENTIKSSQYIAYFIFIFGWVASFSGLSRIFLVMTITSLLTFLLTSKRSQTVMQIIILVAILVYILNNLNPEVLESFQARLTTLSPENISEESRISIWKGFLENIDKYFFWGGTTDYRTLGPSGWYGGPHSVFLNWLVQYGIIGLICYLYLLSGVAKEIIKTRIIEPKVFSFLAAWFVAYLTLISVNETGFYDPSIYVGIGIILAWRNLAPYKNEYS